MGNVDLASLTWEQFWFGVAFISMTGILFSLGMLRLFQERVRAGIILFLLSAVSGSLFLWYAL
ncbi:hypothetical protein [Brevibacillus sp. H7]|uniref:hypothetical protein n=1 Tax=Brevibacillus sp. H7 TaxID=3349138 RepID=UPI00380C4538